MYFSEPADSLKCVHHIKQSIIIVSSDDTIAMENYDWIKIWIDAIFMIYALVIISQDC